ncbi:restriction endonuclease subunit S [Aeromonas allosaccharophila]|uniref:restriction endonuclease subunit S n=1 Tax=Aeromonas allosaccharophila TaxID=656 RepID=UPI002B471FE4|nr:restriction endonuclease subunit S [Aeromonas allosaccharophila]
MKAGWRLIELHNICLFENGDRGENYPSKSAQTTSGIPFINAGHLTDDGIDFSSMNYISKERFNLLGNGKIQPNDFLFCLRGSLGKFACVDNLTEGAIASSLVIVRPTEQVLRGFLSAYFQSDICVNMIEKYKNGAAQPNLSAGNLKKFLIPLPPLPEQQRIVAILDEAFETIAAARANAEQNRQNARALFESYLQSVFSQRGDGWTEKPLGEMATFRNGVNFTKSSQGEPIKILGVKDFQDYYWAPLNSLDSIIPDGTLPDTDTLQQNDIVFVRSNGNPELIGRCLLIGEVQERTTFSGFTIRARRFTEEVLPQYLCHFLKSSHIRRELVDGGNGANIRSLNQGALSKLRINFPVALSEQERIVEQLETMQSETQHLESLYQRKMAALDELKQSLLQQAFSGQL